MAYFLAKQHTRSALLGAALGSGGLVSAAVSVSMLPASRISLPVPVFSPSTTVLKRELLSIPFFGWALRLLNPIAINRGEPAQALKTVLRQGGLRLADGRRIIIFPEGTRSRPGEQLPYNVGGAMLACRTGVPVIPVCLNSGDCWPRGTLIKQPGTIHVVIGAPMDSTGTSAKVLNTLAQGWIEAERTRLRSTT